MTDFLDTHIYQSIIQQHGPKQMRDEQKYFFDDLQKIEDLKQELESWKGTPYKHRTGVKQRGCDCIHLVVNSLKVVGADKGRHIAIPKYAPDWHMHTGTPLLIEGIKAQYDVEEIKIDPDLIRNGDVILFHWGRQAAHSGIYMDGQVYQALTDMKVETRTLKDLEFFERMDRILRVLK